MPLEQLPTLQGCAVLLFSLLAYLSLALYLGERLACWLGITYKEKPQQTFVSLLFGFLTWVCLWAIACCGYRTVCILILPILLLVKNLASREETCSHDTKRSLRLVLACGTITFGLAIIGFLSLEPDRIFVSDFRFYEDAAYMNRLFSVENELGVRNCLIARPRPAPYHYFDLWIITGLQVFLPNFTRHHVLLLVAYPALWTLSILGTLAVLHRLGRVSGCQLNTIQLLALSILGTLGFGLMEPTTFIDDQNWMTLLHTPKLNIFYVWLALYALCCNNFCLSL